jgi:hypothetical protein
MELSGFVAQPLNAKNAAAHNIANFIPVLRP